MSPDKCQAKFKAMCNTRLNIRRRNKRIILNILSNKKLKVRKIEVINKFGISKERSSCPISVESNEDSNKEEIPASNSKNNSSYDSVTISSDSDDDIFKKKRKKIC